MSAPVSVGPTRTCVGCRTAASRSDLLRVVVGEGALAPDPGATRPGRGAWLHFDLECLSAADRRRAFPRALRLAGPLDVDLLRDWLENCVRKAPPNTPHHEVTKR